MLGLRPISSASLSGLVSGAVAYAYPTSDIAANGWLPSSGSDLYAMLDETVASDADYIYSPNNPTTEQFEVKLAAVSDPGTSDRHVIRLRYRESVQDTNYDIKLVQGTTILDSWTDSVSAAEGAVTRARRLSGAVADLITNYADLRVRGVARA